MRNFVKVFRLLIISLISCTSFAQTIDEENELLWEISGNGLRENSYLFGTMHSNDRRIFNFSDSTFYALDRSRIIALETDIFDMFDELDTRRDEVRINYDNEGRPYTSSKSSTSTAYGDEDGMPQFIDAYLQQYCYNSGKQFAQLEEIAVQLGLFDDMSTPDLSQLSIETFLTSKEDMLQLYLKGDIFGMDELLRVSLKVYPDLYNQMIIERNKGMIKSLDSLLKLDPVFCAVGAGHLAGREGLINLLRQKGYKVRKVTASYREEPTEYKAKFRSARSYIYDNDDLGLHIEFPGKPKMIEGDGYSYDLRMIYRELGQGNTYIVEIYPRTELAGLKELAEDLIPSPSESPVRKVLLDNGGEAYQGIADSYLDGIYWSRIIMSEDAYVIIKAYGGNKFMNSNRPFRFFDKVWFD